MGACGCCCDFLGGVFKYIVFFFNLIFVLAGITVLVLGILLEVRILDISEYTDINFHTAAIILMVGGSVAIVISFFGCCGAISNNRSCLNIYAGLLLVAFSLQLAGSIVVFVQNPDIANQLEVEMKRLMTEYPLPPFEGETGVNAQKFWDHVQSNYDCCGIRSNLDWSVYKPGLAGLPESCKCQNDYYYPYYCNEEGYHTNGCYDRLKDLVFDIQMVMACIAIGVASAEIFFGVLTLMYANSRRGKHQVV